MNKDDEFDFEKDWEDENFELKFPKSAPIDKAFYPFDSEQRFQECTMCKKKLTEHSEFLIEKANKGTDVIFEIAICVPCAMAMQKQLSVESTERIEKYMSRVDFQARAQYFLDNPTNNIEDYIGHCVVSGKPIDKKEEHQIYSYCTGDNMLYSAMPYAISGEIMAEIQELLSPETKQEMDDFMEQYLIPDDLRDLLKGRPVFI